MLTSSMMIVAAAKDEDDGIDFRLNQSGEVRWCQRSEADSNCGLRISTN